MIEEGECSSAAGSISRTSGHGLPPSATAERPELAGRAFEAMGVSLVLHPRNPYCPTVHMNVRFFIARRTARRAAWWFGGGMDLTPYYGFDEDAGIFTAPAAMPRPVRRRASRAYKEWCDEYFFLKHRNEPRGVGGIFFDDLNRAGFERCFAMTRAWATPSSRPTCRSSQRRDTPYGERERDFQAYRRGRYVEFNLVYDRGTLFGLQSGGRTESILMSLPPLVKWRYDWQPEPGTPEAALYSDFLVARDWI